MKGATRDALIRCVRRGQSAVTEGLGSRSLPWFHTPKHRGITHPRIVVSHTESRGITHQAFSQDTKKSAFSGRFSSLNLLNDSYLTVSLNPHGRRRARKKGQTELPYGQSAFVACRLSPSQERPDGRRLPGEAERIGGVCLSTLRSLRGQGGRISRNSPFV